MGKLYRYRTEEFWAVVLRKQLCLLSSLIPVFRTKYYRLHWLHYIEHSASRAIQLSDGC